MGIARIFGQTGSNLSQKEVRVLQIAKSHLLRICRLMIHRCLRHRVGIQSAALAFHLLFMFFPLLIFISALLGSVHLNTTEVLRTLEEILPHEVLEVISLYLRHVGSVSSRGMLAFGLVFSVWFPLRASNSLLQAVRTAYHLGRPRRVLRHWGKTLLYTGLLMSTIILTVILMSVSDRILAYSVQNFRLPTEAALLWTRLRFPLIGTAGGFAVLMLYALAQDHRRSWGDLWPGSLAALSGWMLLSWVYAWYVEHMAHYSTLYGSIGAVMVLLVWLNMGAMALIMGAEFNGILIGLRKENDFQKE